MQQRSHQDQPSSSGCGVLSHEKTAAPPRRAGRLGSLLFIGAVGLAAGCSGDSSAATGGSSGGSGGSSAGGTSGGGGSGGGDLDGGDSTFLCSVRPGVDQYAANMTKKGTKGLMSFLLIQSNPAPPIMGSNAWKLKVTGSDGMPVSQGLVVDVFMPDHGHPSPLSPTVTYDPATGVYGLDPIYLSMVGMWRITFTITDPNDSSLIIDKVEFFFCAA
jgi:hypothetical protein